jgi:hypothetical protein
VSFLDAQEYLVVMEQLSLVVEIIDAFELLIIGCNRWLQALIDVFLSYWHIIFHISDIMLVDEIVKLVIHTFDNMVAHKISVIRLNLKHRSFYVVLEVPSDDCYDLAMVIFSKNLDYVLFSSLNELDDLRVAGELEVNILEALFGIFFDHELKCVIVLQLQRCGVLLRSAILQHVSLVNHN